MIAFDSPEGAQLRALRPSQSATLSIWLVALDEGQEDWAHWAQDQLGGVGDSIEVIALRFMQAASDGDVMLARQMWVVLASCPIDGTDNRIIRAARNLRTSLPI